MYISVEKIESSCDYKLSYLYKLFRDYGISNHFELDIVDLRKLQKVRVVSKKSQSFRKCINSFIRDLETK